MDEILNILFTLIIILAFVIKRSRRTRSAERSAPGTEENWPVPGEFFPPIQPERVRPAAESERQTKKQQMEKGQTERRQKGAPSETGGEQAATPQVRTAHAAPNQPDSSAVMEGFDLRKAVVWSEILRPKFQDE